MKDLNIGRRVVLLGTATLLASVGMAPKLHAQTLKEKITSEGKITIGIYNSWPLGFETGEGGVSGLYPDVLRTIADPLGVKKVDFVVMEFGALIPSLMSRRIDAVAGGMNITPARCKEVIFSNPVASGGDAALVKKGNPLNIHSYEDMAKNPHVRVGDMRGASTTKNVLDAGVPRDRIQLFQDKDAGIAALFAGRIDVHLFSVATAMGIVKDPKIEGLERAAPFTGLVENGREKKDSAGFAFRSEDAEFRDLFNKGLAARIADGTVLKILEKYNFTNEELPPKGLTSKDICGDNYR